MSDVISIHEFARRLCSAEHPYYGNDHQVPCGTHMAMARSLRLLIPASGDRLFAVIAELRSARIRGEEAAK